MYDIQNVADNVWKLTEEGWVCSYVVAGTDAALLIDTGLGTGDIREAVEQCTKLPYEVILTHSHGDHMGCIRLFEKVHCHVNELMEVWRAFGEMPYAVAEGFRFDLGGRTLVVKEFFGHTKGSIGLFDEAGKMLFTGDILGDTPVWMTGPDASLQAYIQSMDKLMEMGDQVETFFGSHETVPMNLEWAQKLKTCAQEILKGNYTAEDVTLDNGTVADWAHVGEASMYLTKGRDYNA